MCLLNRRFSDLPTAASRPTTTVNRSMSHRTNLEVRFNELDPYGHVNHSVYVTYFEVGRTSALAHCGVPLEMMAKNGYQMVVTGLEVKFRLPAEAGQRLIVETSVSNLRRASGTWSQRLLRGNEVLVTADVTAAVTDAAGRPTKPPDWLFPALSPLQADSGHTK